MVVPAPENAEPHPEAGEHPAAFARRSSLAKGRALFSCATSLEAVLSQTGVPLAECLVVSADTVVTSEGHIFGKPANMDESLTTLRALNGKKHEVITACSLFFDGREEVFPISANVVFARNSDATLAAYAATGEGLDKAGSYAIQGRGACLIQGIEGSWTSIVGLPVAELIQRLLESNLLEIHTP